MLGEDDDEVARTPVPQQGEEVLQVGQQFVTAGEREGDDDTEAQDGPDEARDAREGPGELLAGDGGAVGVNHVHVDAGED